eukprot:6236389-Amphidinium_carterae.1
MTAFDHDPVWARIWWQIATRSVTILKVSAQTRVENVWFGKFSSGTFAVPARGCAPLQVPRFSLKGRSFGFGHVVHQFLVDGRVAFLACPVCG